MIEILKYENDYPIINLYNKSTKQRYVYSKANTKYMNNEHYKKEKLLKREEEDDIFRIKLV